MKAKFLPLLFLLFLGHCATAQVKSKGTPTKAEASANANFEAYKGRYASAEDPDGILIYTQDNKLVGKIAQQPVIVFEHTGRNLFTSDKTGIIIEFSDNKNQLALKRKESITFLVRQKD